MSHWISHFFGMDNGSGPQYLFWSGIGSDITELLILGGIINFARHRNCHVKGCWRWGNHNVDGTAYKVCRKHHPALKNNRNVSVEEIHKAHEVHRNSL